MVKKFLAILGVFGYAGDTLDALVSKELSKPSLRNDFLSVDPAISELGQGDVTCASGQELLADVARYQERKHRIA